MATTTTITEHEYRELALNDPDHRWELWDGVPVEKPWMSIKHNDVAFYLGHMLQTSSIDGSIGSTSTGIVPASRHAPITSRTSSSFPRPTNSRWRTIRGRLASMPSPCRSWPRSGRPPLVITILRPASGLSRTRRPSDLVHPSVRAHPDSLAETPRGQLHGRALPQRGRPRRLTSRRGHRPRCSPRRLTLGDGSEVGIRRSEVGLLSLRKFRKFRKLIRTIGDS